MFPRWNINDDALYDDELDDGAFNIPFDHPPPAGFANRPPILHTREASFAHPAPVHRTKKEKKQMLIDYVNSLAEKTGVPPDFKYKLILSFPTFMDNLF